MTRLTLAIALLISSLAATAHADPGPACDTDASCYELCIKSCQQGDEACLDECAWPYRVEDDGGVE